jgi:hypothetical protein
MSLVGHVVAASHVVVVHGVADFHGPVLLHVAYRTRHNQEKHGLAHFA